MPTLSFASGTSTFAGTLGGAGTNENNLALTKSGAGTLVLSGANTFGGGVTIGAGVLRVGSASALGTATGAVSVTSGAALDLNGTSMTATNPLTLNGTGISSGGALTNSSVTSGTYAGSVILGSDASIVASASNITLSNSGTITGVFGLTVGGGFNTTIASSIGIGAGSVTKSGNGTLTLSESNGYTGATTVSAGILAIGNQDAVNGTSAISVLTGGATLRIDVPNTTSTTVGAGKSVSIAGNGASNYGALQGAASANVTWAGNVVLSGASISRVGGGDSGTLTVSGVISGTDANAGVLVSRAPNSTTIFSNLNTYTGDTQFFPSGSTVTLKMGIANAISSQSRVGMFSTTSGTAYFDLNGYDQNIRALSDTFTGDLVVTNSSTSSDAQLTLTPTDSQTFNGRIQDGASKKVSIVMLGTGTQVFQAANTYSGDTTVSAGTLRLSDALALQNSTLLGVVTFGSSVSGNAFTFGGLGGWSNLPLQNNAGTPAAVALSVGNNNSTTTYSGVLSGPGSLIKIGGGMLTLSGSNTYSGGASVQWELWGNTASNDPLAFDQILVSGSLAFGGATTLNLAFTGSASPTNFSTVDWSNDFWGTSHEWLVYQATQASTSGFSNLTLATTNWQDSTGASFQSVRGDSTFAVESRSDGIYIVYAAVPEPGTLALAGIGLAAAGWAMRRRRRRT